MKPILQVKNLSVGVEGNLILHNINLSLNPGEIVAIMGPNGSGKSTLALTLAGYHKYQVNGSFAKQNLRMQTRSRVKSDGEDITNLTPDERAKRGLFLAFQQPIAIPGVQVVNFLRLARNEISKYQSTNSGKKNGDGCPTGTWLKPNHSLIPLKEFLEETKFAAQSLGLPQDFFLKRYLNEGFSGGEKKKMEALQALVLKPKVAIFDEIDTGLDIDALKIVASAIKSLAQQKTGVILITHYQRLLKYLKVDKIHILVHGKIVKTGSQKLAQELEKTGYASYE